MIPLTPEIRRALVAFEQVRTGGGELEHVRADLVKIALADAVLAAVHEHNIDALPSPRGVTAAVDGHRFSRRRGAR